MKRKSFYILLITLILCTALIFCLVACDTGGGDNGGNNNPGGDTGNNGDTHEHNFVTKFDDVNHWQECSECGKKKDLEKHQFGTNSNGCKCGFSFDDSCFDMSLSLDDTYEISRYNGDYTDVVIPSVYNGKKVTSIGDFAFMHKDKITNITISDGLTTIGSQAFTFCTGLINFVAPDSLTTIGSKAFFGCNSLVHISLPKDIKDVYGDAFAGTKWYQNQSEGLLHMNDILLGYKGNIASNTVLAIDDSIKTIAVSAFAGNNNITGITIPSSVTTIGSLAFSNCDNLESIVVDEANTIYSAKNNCLIEKATNNVVLGCKASTISEDITSIGKYAFYGCNGLSLTIPKSVTNIEESAFINCDNSILYVNIASRPDGWDKQWTSGVITVLWDVKGSGSNADYKYIINDDDTISIYEYTGQQVDVIIPNTIDGHKTTKINNGIFTNNTSLHSIELPDSLVSIGDAVFSGCTGLTSIVLPSSLTSIGNAAFSGCTGLTNIILPSGLLSIGGEAFKGCTGLTSITIPNSVASIGKLAFGGCIGLTSIVVDGGNANYYSIDNCLVEKVTKKLLLGCNASIIPNDIKSIDDYAFYYCADLKNITLPSSLTDIGQFAFAGCTGITNITIQNGLTSIGDFAFIGCTGLTSIVLPSSLTSIGQSVFSYCTGLTSIKLPDNLSTIQNNAFDNCTALTSIKLPKALTSIADKLFEGCTSLTSVILPDNLTSIGSYAFYNCSKLESIIIPESVIVLGDGAFSDCSLLKIYAKATSKPSEWYLGWGSGSFYWYSATKPAGAPSSGEGYWHYDTDNKTPVIWK